MLEKKQLWTFKRVPHVPLYQQIQEVILGHIQAGRLKPGDLLPSYPWLSKVIGVADKTVRQAYANLQLAGILEIKRGKGTFVARERAPASSQSGPRSGVLGILPPRLPVKPFEAELFWSTLRGIQECAYAERLETTLLAASAGSASSSLDVIQSRRVEGLIVLGQTSEEIQEKLAALRIPMVFAGNRSSSKINAVAFDYASSVRDLTYRLIGQNHRKIGLLKTAKASGAEESEAGFRHAMGSAELPVHSAWIATIDEDLGDSGFAAIEALLSANLTALVALSGSLAQKTIRMVQRRVWSMPANLSLAATVTNPDPSLYLGLEISGAAFDPLELGQRMVQRLLELTSGTHPEPRQELIAARPLEGQTLGAPKSIRG